MNLVQVPIKPPKANDRVVIAALHFGLVILYVYITLWYYRQITDPHSISRVPLGGDFINIWTASHLTWQGKAAMLYNLGAYVDELKTLFAPNIEPHNYGYPPWFLFFILPFGLLPYALSYALWCLSTFTAYVLALRAFHKSGASVVTILALAPASYVNVIVGQNGFISGALFVGGLAVLETRPVMAGVLFGLLTYKPHLGILIPLVLGVRRKWKAIAAAAATAIMLVVLGTLAFGNDMLIAYVKDTSAVQKAIMERGTGMFQYMMPSAFMAIRLLGGPLWVGYALSAVLCLLAAIVAATTWARCQNAELRAAVLLLATVVALPYCFNYDLTLGTAAALLLFPYMKRDEGRVILLLLWVVPLYVVFINIQGVPIGPIVLLAALYSARHYALKESCQYEYS